MTRDTEMTRTPPRRCFIDGSRLVVEAAVRAGADVFVGYPITPANALYLYSSQRFPVVLPAPDEITTLQWMAGFGAAGHLPMTATSYPGLALMVESIGMAFMMELPMVIVLAQRLGPATGTATCGSQGDLLLLRGLNSGAYPIPTLCISDLLDCWSLSAEAVALARRLRTPVVLLTSKEMMMTLQDFDLATLPAIAGPSPAPGPGPDYRPYGAGPDDVPPFVPVGHPAVQVRLTASTHDEWGDLQHTSPAALENTRRLWRKIQRHLPGYTFYELDEQASDTIVVACDVTAAAAREAVSRLRSDGRPVSLLVPKTLFPVPPVYLEILARYQRVVVAEETLTGLYQELLFGHAGRAGLVGVKAIGRMITPEEIVEGVGR